MNEALYSAVRWNRKGPLSQPLGELRFYLQCRIRGRERQSRYCRHPGQPPARTRRESQRVSLTSFARNSVGRITPQPIPFPRTSSACLPDAPPDFNSSSSPTARFPSEARPTRSGLNRLVDAGFLNVDNLERSWRIISRNRILERLLRGELRLPSIADGCIERRARRAQTGPRIARCIRAMGRRFLRLAANISSEEPLIEASEARPSRNRSSLGALLWFRRGRIRDPSLYRRRGLSSAIHDSAGFRMPAPAATRTNASTPDSLEPETYHSPRRRSNWRYPRLSALSRLCSTSLRRGMRLCILACL